MFYGELGWMYDVNGIIWMDGTGDDEMSRRRSMRRTVKGDDGYLRPYAEAERDEAAYAGGDVEILIAVAVKAIVLTIGNLGGAQAEDGELATVGMAAQGKARAAVVRA